jgi:WhiB family redox-sensing transcriptional regulator
MTAATLPAKLAAAIPPFLRDDHRPACHAPNVDPEWWFPLRGERPNGGGTLARAIAICQRCPLKGPCADWAADTGQWGMWGGLVGEQLRQHRLCRNGLCLHPEHRSAS